LTLKDEWEVTGNQLGKRSLERNTCRCRWGDNIKMVIKRKTWFEGMD
jgi:hypothetical protein